MSSKFLFPFISCNELSVTQLYVHIHKCLHVALSSPMASVKSNGRPSDITIPIQSILTFEKSSVSKEVISIYLSPQSKTVRNRARLKRFWTPYWLQLSSPLSKWAMLLHPRLSHLLQLKANGLKEVYSPKLLEPTSPRCQVRVLEIMSRCMNFTVFSFVMVSNNKKVCTTLECYVASIV